MAPDEPRAEFHAPEPGTTFLAFGVHTASMVAITLGEEPRGVVQLSLTGKWNHGAEDDLQVVLDPELAEKIARHLKDAARAARKDARNYLQGKPIK